MRLVLALLALAGCEGADQPQQEPTPEWCTLVGQRLDVLEQGMSDLTQQLYQKDGGCACR